MIKNIYLAIALVIIISNTYAQQSSGFNFLNLPQNTHENALGGVSVTSLGNEVASFNPSFIPEADDKKLHINHTFYYASSAFTQLFYKHKSEKIGSFGVGLRYLGHGKIDGYDEYGNSTTDFRAKDYALSFSKGHKKDNYSIGAKINLIRSSIENYSASALGLDLAGTFHHPNEHFKFGVLIRNLGFTFQNDYTHPYQLPLDIQLGGSIGFEGMPLLFDLTYHHLHQYDISYFDASNATQIVGGTPTVNYWNNFARHFVIGTQLRFSKSLRAKFGYNIKRRFELKQKNLAGLTGISLGFSLEKEDFGFSYAWSKYIINKGMHQLAFNYNLEKVFRKHKTIE